MAGVGGTVGAEGIEEKASEAFSCVMRIEGWSQVVRSNC